MKFRRVMNIVVPTLIAGLWMTSAVFGQVDRAKSFVVRRDDRGVIEKWLNEINVSTAQVGRSYALVAGVSRYQNMTPPDDDLTPAHEDLESLVRYLRDVELFDEVVRLENEAVSYDNLRYFLQVYFPERLGSSPRSRLLVAFSGHGNTDEGDAYVLQSDARNLSDRERSIDMRTFRSLVDSSRKKAHSTLVLLNACYAGEFLARTFGPLDEAASDGPGAYAITAGGPREKTWQLPAVGPGSVFFEVLSRGLRGSADIYPNGGDGLITAHELFAYMRSEIRKETSNRQTPHFGDLSTDPSPGTFLFLRRGRPVEKTSIGAKLKVGKLFGEIEAPDTHPPRIATFAAVPDTISLGEASQLSWETEYASTCTISSGLGAVALAGKRRIEPIRTTSYTLSCRGPGGLTHTDAVVHVQIPPRIVRFDAEPEAVKAGEEVTLTWETVGATACTIASIGDVPLNGTKYLFPRKPVRYVLMCTGDGASADSAVGVRVLSAPSIRSFSLSETTIVAGDDITATWKASDVASCSLEGPGVSASYLEAEGRETVSPSRSGNIVLTCEGEQQRATRTLKVTVRKRQSSAYCCNAWGQRVCKIMLNSGPLGAPCWCSGVAGVGTTCEGGD